MGPASGEAWAVIAPVLVDELVIGSIAIHLKDAAIAAKMSAQAVAGPAFLEAVGHHVRRRLKYDGLHTHVGPSP